MDITDAVREYHLIQEILDRYDREERNYNAHIENVRKARDGKMLEKGVVLAKMKGSLTPEAYAELTAGDDAG